MARCGCGGGGSCNCSVIAGSNTSVSGSGSSANPYVINSITNPAQVRTSLSAGCGITYSSATGVISSDISENAGNALQCLANGLFVQTGAATVTAGCGLTGTGAPGNPLVANTQAWFYACDVGTAGGIITCDPDTGELKGEPRSHANMSTINEVQAFANLPVPANDTVIRTITGNFTNPDPCRTAIAIVEREVEFDVLLPANAQAHWGFAGDIMMSHTNRGTGSEPFSAQMTKVLNAGTVAPGATVAFSWDAVLGAGTNGATYSNCQQILRVMMITQ